MPRSDYWKPILILSTLLGQDLPCCLFPSGISIKTVYAHLLFPLRATCYAQSIILDFITRMIFGEEYRAEGSSFYSLFHSPVTLPRLSSNSFPCTLFSYIFRLCFSLIVKDQTSDPYKRTLKIIVLYILYFWIASWETEGSLLNDSKFSRSSICPYFLDE